MLTPVGGPGTTVYIELDRCRRILVVGGNGRPLLAQADAAFVALIDQLG